MLGIPNSEIKLETYEKWLEVVFTVFSEAIPEYPGLSYKNKHQAPSYRTYSKEKECSRKPLHSNEDSQLKDSLLQLG